MSPHWSDGAASRRATPFGIGTPTICPRHSERSEQSWLGSGPIGVRV